MKWLRRGLILLGFLSFSAVVWFAGPLIAIGGSVPLDSVLVRLLIIGTLAAILLI